MYESVPLLVPASSCCNVSVSIPYDDGKRNTKRSGNRNRVYSDSKYSYR